MKPFVIPGRCARFVLPLAGTSKKNNRQPGQKRMPDGRLLQVSTLRPSATYLAFEAAAVPLVRSQFGNGIPLDRATRAKSCPWRPVAVDVLFLVDSSSHFDLSGMQEAVGDMLQKAGVIRNDYSIVRWRAWRDARSSKAPRIVIEVGVFSPCPEEDFGRRDSSTLNGRSGSSSTPPTPTSTGRTE